MATQAIFTRSLPEPLRDLADLALDLRWNMSHATARLWQAVDEPLWRRSRNPWIVLQSVPATRLAELAEDAGFRSALAGVVAARRDYLESPGWFGQTCKSHAPHRIAYFSMEFGLGESLPLYAGGLGVLAGDYLKAASDLAVPMVGVGLLYQEGYFRQMLDAEGTQQEVYPYNDPTMLPIRHALSPSGDWLRIRLDLPARPLWVRVWRAEVGRVPLFLLDCNDPLNSPSDRSITAKLYGGGPEMRLMQEIVLGVAGWRALEEMGAGADVLHLNEGHAAFAAVERARLFMESHGIGFREALWATRGSNLFTTHTAVAAGFDLYGSEMIALHFPLLRRYVARLGIELAEFLALGRRNAGDDREPFNMAWLAMRCCARANGVSRLHGEVSRRLFADLFPRWPVEDVPVGHVTNGVHVPTWDSPWSDRIWTDACGRERWMGAVESLATAVEGMTDEALWEFRASERQDLVQYARARLAQQLGRRGADPAAVAEAERVLDPNALTLGFARRFAEYKRPNLLLADPQRFVRLLSDPGRPVQIIVAGKAHPRDLAGKRLVQDWLRFAGRAEVRMRCVFLEDYDMVLAQEMVQGVDVWINTPRRPWEACGTSGMKVLANGGLNLSVLDGWWAEAWARDLGWAVGDSETDGDARHASELYRVLEEEVVPAYYERDAHGIPRSWVARIRASMSRLAPRFSSNRMVCDYAESFYRPAAAEAGQRSIETARALAEWQVRLERHWRNIRFGPLAAERRGDMWDFGLQVYLGELAPDDVRVELHAQAEADQPRFLGTMLREEAIPGALHGYLYRCEAPGARPSTAYTPRVVPHHPSACVPAEVSLIAWQR